MKDTRYISVSVICMGTFTQLLTLWNPRESVLCDIALSRMCMVHTVLLRTYHSATSHIQPILSKVTSLLYRKRGFMRLMGCDIKWSLGGVKFKFKFKIFI